MLLKSNLDIQQTNPCLAPALGVTKFENAGDIGHTLLWYLSRTYKFASEVGLLNKSLCLAAALGATYCITINSMIIISPTTGLCQKYAKTKKNIFATAPPFRERAATP